MFAKWFLALSFWTCYANGQQDYSDCLCVPFYLCTKSTIITSGEGIIDIRAKPNECDSYLEKYCCLKDKVNNTDIRLPKVAEKSQCGQRHRDGVGYRIIGDDHNEAQFGEFPWMVAILNKEKNQADQTFQCGGSLIHPQVVLTAAHCVQGSQSSQMKIRVGEWDTQTENELFPFEERNIQSITIHNQFNSRNLHNDIAILFLQSPVNSTSHISPACLPPTNFVSSGGGCFVTGWGKENFEKEGQYQTILKKIELPVVNRELCQNAFRGTRLGRFFNLHQSFMCAGGEQGKDACLGDGGGPLVCPIEGEDDRYYQVGVVSWGIGCGDSGIPGAYVDVAHFRSWIDQQIKLKNFEKDSYVYQ